MELICLSERKDSIRKKYSLLGFTQKLGNELQLQSGTNFIMQVEGSDLPSCGNLCDYSISIKDERVVDYMKSLKFSYKREKEYAES